MPPRTRSHAPSCGQARLAAPCLALVLALCAVLVLPQRALSAERQLVFGMSAAFSGPARGLGLEYYRGLMASFEHTNAQGGAGGWRLVLSLRDDGYDPLPALANTIGFVEQERVFALLGYVGTPTTARVLPLLKHYESEHMALLFPCAGADLLRERPYDAFVFNLRASYLDETRVLVEALLASGKRHIAVFHQADVYGRNGWDGVRRVLRAHGRSIAAEATYRRGAAYTQDFRREVALLEAVKPDAIVTVGTAPACAGFIRDAREAGLSAPIAALSFADADNLVKFLLAQTRITGRDYTSGLVFSQVVPCYAAPGCLRRACTARPWTRRAWPCPHGSCARTTPRTATASSASRAFWPGRCWPRPCAAWPTRPRARACSPCSRA